MHRVEQNVSYSATCIAGAYRMQRSCTVAPTCHGMHATDCIQHDACTFTILDVVRVYEMFVVFFVNYKSLATLFLLLTLGLRVRNWSRQRDSTSAAQGVVLENPVWFYVLEAIS